MLTPKNQINSPALRVHHEKVACLNLTFMIHNSINVKSHVLHNKNLNN